MNSDRQSTKYFNLIILSGILLLGLFLRLNGLEWGLPNELHPTYSYHPDEIYLLTWADWLQQGHIIPKHFIYGGTFYYLTLQFTNWLGSFLTGQIGGQQLFNIILLGRLLGVVYALLTICLIYAAGSILYSNSVGLLASFILSVLPGHIFWAQRVRPDELFALLFVLNLLFMARIIKHQGKIKINLFLGGLLLGIATATRFPAAVLFLGYTVAMAFVFSQDFRENRAAAKRKTFQSFGMMSGAAVLGYLAASPHTVFYLKDFVSGLLVQWHYQADLFIDGINKGPNWFQYGGRIFRQAMSEPFHGLTFIALAFAIWKKTKEHLLLLAIVAPYFLLLANTSWIVTRYTIPLLPIFSLLIASFLLEMAVHSKTAKALVVSIIIGSASWSLTASLAYSNTLKTTDPRDAAATWIIENLETGATIGAFIGYDGDYFNNPPATQEHRWFFFNMKQDDVDRFLEIPFDYIVVNELSILDARRLGADYPMASYRKLNEWSARHPGYSLLRQFSNEASIAGLDFGYLFTSIDYMLSRPRLSLYKKTGSENRATPD